jgi:hypothetical protein
MKMERGCDNLPETTICVSARMTGWPGALIQPREDGSGGVEGHADLGRTRDGANVAQSPRGRGSSQPVLKPGTLPQQTRKVKEADKR